MRKSLLLAVALSYAMGTLSVANAEGHNNAAEGKAIGQNEKGEKGRSASAPGKTGATGSENAPGQAKKGE